jgi:hypothetical protein
MADFLLWLTRVLVIGVGFALAGRGIGDAAMWEGVAGGAVALVGAVLSWRARQSALRTPPPG